MSRVALALFSILLVGCSGATRASSSPGDAVIASSAATSPLRVVLPMTTPTPPHGRAAFDDENGDVVRPCAKGSDEAAAAHAAIEALGERMARLDPWASPTEATAEVRRLLATECFRFASWEGFGVPTFASAFSAKTWWTAGGEEWLSAFVDLDEHRRIVVPPSPRRALTLDLGGAKSPLAPLLCPASAGAGGCGQETVGWMRRMDAAFERVVSVVGEKTDEDCLDEAKKLEGTARFEHLHECLTERVHGRTALPLGRFRAPQDGWLVTTGGAGRRCVALRAYDLATGAAFMATDCAGTVTTKAGRLPVGALREAAWMLMLAPVAEEDVRVGSTSFVVPDAIAIERPSNGGRGSTGGRCTTGSSMTRHWSWMRGGDMATGQTSGIVRWPGGKTGAERHATELLAIAEDAFEEGCAPAAPPKRLRLEAPGPSPDGKSDPASFEEPAMAALVHQLGPRPLGTCGKRP